MFSTRSADRLWLAAIKRCTDKKNEKFDREEKLNHPEEIRIKSSLFNLSIFGGSSVSSKNTTAGKVTKSGGTEGAEIKGGIERHAAVGFSPSSHLLPDCADGGLLGILVALAAMLRVLLAATDDKELYEQGIPLPLAQIVRLVRTYKMILYHAIRYDPSILAEPSSSSPDKSDHNEGLTDRLFRYGAVRSISAVLSDLYLRWARRPFSSASLWEVDMADTSSVRNELRAQTPFAVALLRTMPWAVDFYERLKIFREVVDTERVQMQGSLIEDPFHPQPRSKGVMVRVRRSQMLLDGMAAFDKVGGSIKDRVVVKYLNDFGEEEAGIDIGGLFKDFLTEVSTRIFDPSYGLFSSTSENLLYPNPAASLLYPGHGELEALYCFLGRVLGKALFENITIQSQFAHFFLAFMSGRYNFMNLINDLSTLDQELYKNLMFLKTYEGDIGDLCLTFSISDTTMGTQTEKDLVPGGSKLNVTSKNRHRYINAVAKHYLYDRLKRQSRAFFMGLYQVIQPDLLSIFCAPELQVVISGSNKGISIDDLKRNTRYGGGYSSIDRNISRFWLVFEELSVADRGHLIKFVTSCERPPSLGEYL